MRGVNKVILVGHLGRDPEVRYTASGLAVATLSLATHEAWRDKTTGEPKEQTEWHRVMCYGDLAETAGAQLRKGNKVYVEGSLHTRKWQDKETGKDRYLTEVKGATLEKVDSPEGARLTAAANDAQFPAYEDIEPAQNLPKPSAAPRRGYTARMPKSSAAARAYDFDEDIPF